MNGDRAAGAEDGDDAEGASPGDADRTVRIDETGAITDAADPDDDDSPTDAGSAAHEEPEPDGFGRAGWALTAALITCTLIIPGIIYLYPYVLGRFELSFFGTYLALPMIPAVLLGAIAVWSMTAATPGGRDEDD